MKLSSFVCNLALVIQCTLWQWGDGARIRGGRVDGAGNSSRLPVEGREPESDYSPPDYFPKQQQHRLLHMEDFVSPLSCNEGVHKKECTLWSQKFGTQAVHKNRVIIDCGECIEMDFAGGPAGPGQKQLVLLNGMDIRGRLIVKHATDVTINTTLVAVQGELILHGRKVVDGTPSVKFIMTGEKDQYFQPVEENAMKCNHGGLCNAGKKVIVVAGGRIRAGGLPDNTPTWVKLHDVQYIPPTTAASTDSDATLFHPYIPPISKAGCDVNGMYFTTNMITNDDVCLVSTEELEATPGAKFECTNTAFKVFDRTSTRHGIQLDLKYIRDCLESTRTYLFTARLRLSKSVQNVGDPTECTATGTNCLVVEQWHMASNLQKSKSILWRQSPTLGSKYGDMLTIATEVTFSPAQLQDTNVYQLINIVGAGVQEDMELEELNLYLPPQNLFVDSTTTGNEESCQNKNLAPPNANAEQGGWSPYPLYASHSWLYVTVEEETAPTQQPSTSTTTNTKNLFFQIRGRDGREKCGLSWDLDPTCLTHGTYLSFSVDVRLPIGSTSPSLVLQPRLVVENAVSGDVQQEEILVDCPLVSTSEWTTCAGRFVVPPSFFPSSSSSSADDTKFRVELGGTGAVTGYDLDNLSLVVVGNDPNILIVDQAVQGKWGVGAEILITSHTTQWDGHQVRTITGIWEHTSNDQYVQIQLNQPIPRPTTVLDDARFAVEVALLSRNIRWEGGPDSNPLHGGHFLVMHTPMAKQLIEGVEIQNFGQQGTLGRYPLHFHFCGKSGGGNGNTVIAKNTIRDSNQRAIVIHGTDETLVEENVIFNTKGHGFLLEDGMEQGNVFLRNLGAATGAVDVVIPDNGSNGEETDNFPATFWISNPSNIFVGNVAAGSESSGFWFELKLRGTKASLYPKLNPKFVNLGQFRDNVAHSNADRGLRTYPRGFVPDERAELIGFSSYRNRNKGLFFHHTDNINVKDSLFADNGGVGLDLDQVQDIGLENVTVIGQSGLYRDVVVTTMTSSSTTSSFCTVQDKLVGIELHTFVRSGIHTPQQYGATTIRNVTFAGFPSELCPNGVAHIQLDEEVQLSVFDAFITLQDVNIQNSTLPLIDFCPASNISSYIIDLDGSFLPPTASASMTGTASSYSIISPSLITFVPNASEHCHVNTDGCYAYCSACFRTVQFETDPSSHEALFLKICQEDGSTTTCDLFPPQTNPEMDARNADNSRVFTAPLPQGSYAAAFVKKASDGSAATEQEVWPTFAIPAISDFLCPDSFTDQDIQLKIPSIANEEQECGNLIRNGNAEALDGWLYRSSDPNDLGGLVLSPQLGKGGSTALVEKTFTNRKRNERDSISQFLDTRCFAAIQQQQEERQEQEQQYPPQRRTYEIHAWMKLVDDTGTQHACKDNPNSCPEIRIVTTDETRTAVATLVPHSSEVDDGFQLLHGLLVVDPDLANSDMIEFSIRRNRPDDDYYSILLDDVSMRLLPTVAPQSPLCREQNLVENGNFGTTGGAEFWSQSTANLSIVRAAADSDSSYHLVLSSGSGGYGQVYLRAGCFQAGERYQTRIQLKMFNQQGQPVLDCDAVQCPSARLIAFRDGVFVGGQKVVRALDTTTFTSTSTTVTLYGVFTATQEYAQAQPLFLRWDELLEGYEYHIESVTMQYQPAVCETNVLVVNNDFGMGVTSFWTATGSGTVEWIPQSNHDTTTGAMLIHHRNRPGHGAQYNTGDFLDPRCLIVPTGTAAVVWEITADVQVLDASTQNPVVCNPSPTQAVVAVDACPSVVLQIKDRTDDDSSVVVLWEESLRSYTDSSWDVSGWNTFRATVTLPTTLLPLLGPNDGSSSSSSTAFLTLQIRNFPTSMDALVDNFVVRQIQ